MKAGNPRKRRAVCFWAAAVLFLFPLLAKAAGASGGQAFSFALSETQGRPGDSVELTVSYGGGLGELGAFFVQVDFDPAAFSYVSVKKASAVQSGYALTTEQADGAASVYVMKEKGEGIGAGTMFTYRFRLKEGAAAGKADFSVSVYNVLGPSSERLEGSGTERLCYTVLPQPREKAALLSLRPDTGVLQPEFSPDCFLYRMEVPFEVTSVTFLAEAAEGGTCKVNRKSLGAGGGSTPFLVTVTAEDQKTKAEYRIEVYREEKAVATPLPSVSPAPSPTVGASTPAPRETASPSSGGAGREDEPAPSPAQAAAWIGPSLSPAPQREKEEEKRETGSGEETDRGPAITIQNGQPSYQPLLWALLFLLLTVTASGPLSKWIAAKFPEEKGKGGEKDKDRKDK